jgi:hypothetical protein
MQNFEAHIGQSNQQDPPTNCGPQFKFQLTPLNNIARKGYSTLLVNVIATNAKVTKPDNHQLLSNTMVCNELPSDAILVQRSLPGNNTSDGIILRTRIERLSLVASNLPRRSVEFVSLESLISDRHREVKTIDRMLIAINFAYTLLHLYSSPWV